MRLIWPAETPEVVASRSHRLARSGAGASLLFALGRLGACGRLRRPLFLLLPSQPLLLADASGVRVGRGELVLLAQVETAAGPPDAIAGWSAAARTARVLARRQVVSHAYGAPSMRVP